MAQTISEVQSLLLGFAPQALSGLVARRNAGDGPKARDLVECVGIAAHAGALPFWSPLGNQLACTELSHPLEPQQVWPCTQKTGLQGPKGHRPGEAP
ncbi:MAG: hypothetical protein WHX93_03045 [bacterium]